MWTKQIHPSWRLARNTLSGKRGRTALIVSSVTLATSLVVAVSTAMASVRASLEVSLGRFIGSADARIIHQFNGRFEDTWLETVRSWPEVERATAHLLGEVVMRKIVDDEVTETPTSLTTTAIGVEFQFESEFWSLPITAGRLPNADEPHAILLDTMSAEMLQAQIGDSLEFEGTSTNVAPLTVVGIYDRPGLGVIQKPLVRIDFVVLAEHLDQRGTITSLQIKLKNGSDVESFCNRYRTELPDELELEPAEIVKAGFDRQLQASQFGLLVMSILTFLCAALIIVMALTTAITQRQREMAITRCIGASRAQLFLSQILLGFVVAAIGVVAGTPIGIGLTAFLVMIFREYLPAGISVNPFGIQLAVIGALGAGIIGALLPAWLASRVSPLVAMTVQGKPPRNRGIVVSAIVGIGLIGMQLLLMGIEHDETRFYSYAIVGIPSVLLGYFLIAVPIFVGFAALFARPMSALIGLPRDVLFRSVLAAPLRNGFTAGALMLGVAILIAGQSEMKSLMNDWIGKIRFADGFAYRLTGITTEHQQAIERLPVVRATCPITVFPIRILDRKVFGIEGQTSDFTTCVGFDVDTFFDMNVVQWAAGKPETAIPRLKDGSGIIVADRFLTTQNIDLGETITLGSTRVQKEFEIVGAVSSAGLDLITNIFGIRNQYLQYSISCVFMDIDTVRDAFRNDDAYMLQIDIADDVDDEHAEELIEAAVPGVQFHSGRWIVATINQIAGTLVGVNSTVAFIALILAAIAVANVIIAGIRARAYEFGVLRAIGATRGVVAKLIIAEATLLGLTGAATGTILGIHIAYVEAHHFRALVGIPMSLAIALLPTILGWAALLALTILATIPAIRSVTTPSPSTLLSLGRLS